MYDVCLGGQIIDYQSWGKELKLESALALTTHTGEAAWRQFAALAILEQSHTGEQSHIGGDASEAYHSVTGLVYPAI